MTTPNRTKFEKLGLKKPEMVSRSFYIEESIWLEFKRQCETNNQSASEVVAMLVKKFTQE